VKTETHFFTSEFVQFLDLEHGTFEQVDSALCTGLICDRQRLTVAPQM
jgi:hypothetical protein